MIDVQKCKAFLTNMIRGTNMKRSKLQKIIREELFQKINEAADGKYSVAELAKAFDKKTKNEFGLSKYKFGSNDEAKLNPKDFGLWGQLLKSVVIMPWSKPTTVEEFTAVSFNLSWQYKSGGSNGSQIGTVWVDNNDPNRIGVRLEDGRYLKP